MDRLAYAIDHGVELLGKLRFFSDPAFESVSRGIEESPCRPVAPCMRRVFPCVHDGADALQVNHVLPVHLENGVVSLLRGQRRLLIGDKSLILHEALSLEGLDNLLYETGQLLFGFDGVFALDDVIGQHRKIIADHHSGAECDSNRKRSVVAVSQPKHVAIFAILTAKREYAEIAVAVRRYAVMP